MLRGPQDAVQARDLRPCAVVQSDPGYLAVLGPLGPVGVRCVSSRRGEAPTVPLRAAKDAAISWAAMQGVSFCTAYDLYNQTGLKAVKEPLTRGPVHEDGMPDPPSYEEVLKEDAQRQQGSQSAPPAGAAAAPPPPRPPRPGSGSKPRPQTPQYPPRPQASAPVEPNLPWRYPRGYWCPKCKNTGYKIKNGRSCRSCWRRFAPPNNSGTLPALTYSGGPWSSPFSARPMYAGGPGFAGATSPGGAPLVVQPGDPRLGGVVCGECRGSGRVSFLLDEDICPLCRGIGRIIT